MLRIQACLVNIDHLKIDVATNMNLDTVSLECNIKKIGIGWVTNRLMANIICLVSSIYDFIRNEFNSNGDVGSLIYSVACVMVK